MYYYACEGVVNNYVTDMTDTLNSLDHMQLHKLLLSPQSCVNVNANLKSIRFPDHSTPKKTKPAGTLDKFFVNSSSPNKN